MPRNSLNLRTASIFFVLLLALTACSNTAPSGVATDSSASDTSADVVPDEIAMAETESADSEGLSEQTAPEEQTGAPANDDSDPASSGKLPRTTAEGILLTAETTDFDFGNGEVPTLEISADSPIGLSGIYIALDDLVADTSSVNVLRWVGSGDTMVVLAETAPSVERVRLTSNLGAVDETAPNDSGFAVLGVIFDSTNDLDGLELEAFDAEGNLVAACAPSSLLFNCPFD